jgi:hypothetical protein
LRICERRNVLTLRGRLRSAAGTVALSLVAIVHLLRPLATSGPC